MRLMSFALTAPQFYARRKIVTRRLGWDFLEAGELLCGVVMNRIANPTRLAVIRVVSARREPLWNVTPDEVAKEGFPGMSASKFVNMFRESHESCAPGDIVTRIEYRYLPGGRFPAVGFCRVCGCSHGMGCQPDRLGRSCSWVHEDGWYSGAPTTLCSRCFSVLGKGSNDVKRI